MNLLSAPDKPEDSTPPGDTFRKFNKMFRFGLSRLKAWDVAMLELNLFGVEGSLRFIEYKDVFWRN